MASKNYLFADYLKTVDDILELAANGAELDTKPVIKSGTKPNEITVPTFVMDTATDCAEQVCDAVKLTSKTVQFGHDVTPEIIEKGFAYFKEFVNAFRQELSK